MRKVYVKTFGCKVNYAESVEFAELIRQAGFNAVEVTGGGLPDQGGSDEAVAGKVASTDSSQPIVLVNSCCVTAKAERKVLHFVRRTLREHPLAQVLLTGCSARHPDLSRSYAEAGARVLGFYTEALNWLADNFAGEPDAQVRPLHARTRAFIKIQDGCTCRCSYCIIPQVRPYYSRPPAEVLAELDRRLLEGYRELVLAGVNLGHYGRAPWRAAEETAAPAPGPLCLHELIEILLSHVPEGTRLRLSSIEPEDVSDRLLDMFANPRFCTHLHMPLQSGSDSVLQAMRRKYTAAQYLEIAREFRRRFPDGVITADIMVGFPGESDADFAATLDLCERVGFERVHCFPFSPRPGTPAAELAAMPRRESVARNRELIARCQRIVDRRWQRFVGSVVPVLIEESDGERVKGHGDAYQVVNLPASAGRCLGRIFPVRLTGYAEREFDGELDS